MLGEGRTSRSSAISIESVTAFVAEQTKQLPLEFQKIFLEDLVEAGKSRIQVLANAAKKTK